MTAVRRFILPIAIALLLAPFLLSVHSRASAAHRLSAGAQLTINITPSTLVAGGDTVVFHIRSQAGVAVTVTVRFQNGQKQKLSGRTGKHGSLAIKYVVPLHVYLGTITVTARAVINGQKLAARTTFQVPYTIYITDVAALVRQGTTWVPTKQVHIGQDVRFQAALVWEEEAGVFMPPDGFQGGTVRVLSGSTTIYSSRMTGGGPQTDYVYADTTFNDSAQIGSLTVRVTYRHDHAHLTFTLSP